MDDNVRRGAETVDERYILEVLKDIQEGQANMIGDIRELKADQRHLKEAWDGACVPSSLNNLNSLTKECAQRIDKIEMRRQKPIAVIVAILSSVTSSVLTYLFTRFLGRS